MLSEVNGKVPCEYIFTDGGQQKHIESHTSISAFAKLQE